MKRAGRRDETGARREEAGARREEKGGRREEKGGRREEAAGRRQGAAGNAKQVLHRENCEGVQFRCAALSDDYRFYRLL